MAALGGDPAAIDWSAFRPLRRYREEDWSDWLAQLIEDSHTGRFACSLLERVEEGRLPTDYMSPEVRREVPHEGYRADLVIAWTDCSYTHIEVKVGDPGLSKTLETAHSVERLCRNLTCRSDAVLLLPSQRDAWDAECERQPFMSERVKVLTWFDVAHALRDALGDAACESMPWRVWAHAFCGAVEQDLLDLAFRPTVDEWARALTPSGLDMAAKLLAQTGAS